MSNTAQTDPLLRLLKHRGFQLFMGVLLAGLLFISVLPLLIAHFLKSGLEQQGLAPVLIEDVDFNPFSGVFILRGLEGARDGRTVLSASEVWTRVDWLPLWERRLWLPKLHVQDLFLDLTGTRDGALKVAGIPIPEATTAKPNSEPWGLGLAEVRLRGVRLDYDLAGLTGQLNLRSAIDDLVSWSPDQATVLVLEGLFNEAPFQISGNLRAFAAQPDFIGEIGVSDLDISQLPQGDFGRASGSLALSLGLEARATADGPSLKHSGTVTLSEAHLESQLGTLRGQRLSWQGSSELHVPEDAQQPLLRASGKAELKGMEVQLAIAGNDWLRTLDARLDGRQQLVLERDPKGHLQVDVQGEILAPYIQLDGERLQARQEALDWRGTARLGMNMGSGEIEVHTSSRLELGALQGDLPQQGVNWRQSSLQWRGEGRLSLNGDHAQYALLGDAALAGIRVLDHQHGARRLVVERLQLTQAAVKGADDIHLQQLQLKGLQVHHQDHGALAEVPPRQQILLEMPALTLNEASWRGEAGLELTEVHLSRARLLLQRQKDGTLYGLATDAAATPAAVADAGNADPQAANSPPVVRIGRLLVDGPGRVDFRDRSVEPPFETSLDIEHLSLARLDSGNAEQASSLELKARLGRHATLGIQGQVQPFAAQLDMDLRGNLQALELPPLSSYTGTQLGYNLDSGQLQAELALKAKSGALDGTADLQVANLTVSKVSEEKLAAMKESMGMPLEAALALLQDKQDNIELSLPIQGDVNNPDVDVSDAINQALGKAMRTGALGYLALALQPFGAIALIAQVAGNAVGGVQLEAVQFQPTAIEISEPARDYAGKLSELMVERPEIRIKLCGHAAPADRQALLARSRKQQEAVYAKQVEAARKAGRPLPERSDLPELQVAEEDLLKLAGDRAEALKSLLVDEHGQEASRLFVCKPALDDADADTSPRVALLI